MSISEKQLEANRGNAKKSTGPKSPSGKAHSSKNATKHGVYSNDIIIRSASYSEDPGEYQQLLESLEEELKPVGRLQAYMVQVIGNCIWRSMRVVRAETAHVTRQVASLEREVEWAIDCRRRNVPEERRDEFELSEAEVDEIRRVLIGKGSIPNDATSRYLLYCEMRLDRQLTRAYRMLRQLQLTPKKKWKRDKKIEAATGVVSACDSIEVSDRELAGPLPSQG